MNYGSEFQNKISSVNQGEDEEVADELSDNSSRFSKDGFPQLNIERKSTWKYGPSGAIKVRMLIR